MKLTGAAILVSGGMKVLQAAPAAVRWPSRAVVAVKQNCLLDVVMQIDGYHRTWQVKSVRELKKTLAWRDSRGGAMFWMAHDGKKYPCLAIRATGDVADVHFIPEEYNAGFRCLGGEGLPEGEWTTLIFEGCDPGTGEDTPNEFVVPFKTAVSIAEVFFRDGEMSDEVKWLQL